MDQRCHPMIGLTIMDPFKRFPRYAGWGGRLPHWFRPRLGVRRRLPAIDDARITAAVRAAIAGEPELSGQAIEVETVNGAVRLRGQVDTPLHGLMASEVAARVEGVRAVSNELRCRPGGGGG